MRHERHLKNTNVTRVEIVAYGKMDFIRLAVYLWCTILRLFASTLCIQYQVLAVVVPELDLSSDHMPTTTSARMIELQVARQTLLPFHTRLRRV
jgi:hypothetical protein